MPPPPMPATDGNAASIRPVRKALTDADYARVVWHVGSTAFDRIHDDHPNVVWHVGAGAVHRMRADQPDLMGSNLREAQRGAMLERIAQERQALERLAAQLTAAKATARAVAHALNQPLAIIQGAAEMLQAAPPGESPTPDFAEILAATGRMAAIIRDLLRVTHYTTLTAADGNPMLDLSTAIDPPGLLE